MHKYFNFAKIFEAEQMGEPLSPEEMGTPDAPSIAPTDAKKSEEPVTVDFDKMQATHKLDVLITDAEIDQLEQDGTLIKPDVKLVNKQNIADNPIQVSMKMTIAEKHKSGSLDDPNAIAFVISEDEWEVIKKGLDTGMLNTALPTTKSNEKFSITFAKEQSATTQPYNQRGVAPSDSQVTAGTVPPVSVQGTIESKPTSEPTSESRGLMNFSQFVNEAKKDKWISDVVGGMKKGALRKEMGMKKGEKMDLTDIAKSEAKLKKKDKDKKKPGLQLDKKDARTHKRNTLAKNLIKASKGK